jgi:hypothetical protein
MSAGRCRLPRPGRPGGGALALIEQFVDVRARRAAPEESRGGPINYLDADLRDVVPLDWTSPSPLNGRSSKPVVSAAGIEPAAKIGPAKVEAATIGIGPTEPAESNPPSPE